MEPLNLLGLRFLIAFILLFHLFLNRMIKTIKKDPAIIRSSFLLGSIYFLCMASELYGLKHTTSSTCSFLENTAIVMVLVIETVLLWQRPKPIIMLSTIVTVAGIALLVFRNGVDDGNNKVIGKILCLIAALMYAAAIIITDRLSKKFDPMTLGILYVGFMGIMGITASFYFESPHLPQTGVSWTYLIALAVLCTSFGFTMQPVAQKPITSETTGIICALNPMTTAVLSWLLLGDSLGVNGILGALLIIGGILLPNLTSSSSQNTSIICNHTKSSSPSHP